MVGFVLVQFLYGLAGAGGYDNEVGVSEVVFRKGNSGLAREDLIEAFAGELKARLVVFIDRNAEMVIDEQLALAHLDVRRHGHQSGCRGLGQRGIHTARRANDQEERNTAKDTILHEGQPLEWM